MRRLTLAALGLCACMSAQAALYNPDAQRLQVNIPNLKGGVDFSVSIGYLETDFHNTDVVVIDANLGNSHPKGPSDALEICQDFGYGAMLGWKFQNTGNDFRAQFFHFEVDDSKVFTKGPFWAAVGNVDDPGFLHRAQSAGTRFGFDLDSYDVEVAQHLNIGCRAGMRLLAGISLHKVTKSTRIGYTGIDFDETKSSEVTMKSCFDGIGPRVGVDFDYYLLCNIGFVGHISTAYLIGSIDSRTTILNSNPESSINGNGCLEIKHNDRCVTVPMVDLRLAFDYTYCLRPHEQIRAEFGYWVKHYYDCINDIHVINGNNNANYINNLSSINFNGLYCTFMAIL